MARSRSPFPPFPIWVFSFIAALKYLSLWQLLQVLSWLLDGSVNPDVLNRQKQVTWFELNVGFKKK